MNGSTIGIPACSIEPATSSAAMSQVFWSATITAVLPGNNWENISGVRFIAPTPMMRAFVSVVLSNALSMLFKFFKSVQFMYRQPGP